MADADKFFQETKEPARFQETQDSVKKFVSYHEERKTSVVLVTVTKMMRHSESVKFDCLHLHNEGLLPAQESDVYLVKIAECQPKWSFCIIKYTRIATDFGSNILCAYLLSMPTIYLLYIQTTRH